MQAVDGVLLPPQPGQRERGLRRIGTGAAQAQLLAAHQSDRLARQCLLAAEQMGAAGNIQHQPVRRIERDHRREAVAEVGQPLETVLLGLGTVRHRQQPGHARLRVGQRHAGLETERQRILVQRVQPEGAALAGNEDERRRVRRRCASLARRRCLPLPPAVEIRRQKGEDERQEAPLA